MGRHIYQTEGFVIGHKNTGESNRLFYLLTRDFGLVVATAQGVRELKSKLRYTLQYLSYANINLVRGKGIWRLTTAEKLNHINTATKKENRIVAGRITNLLKRLLVHEAKHPDIFEETHEALDFLSKETLSPDEYKALEVIFVMRVLNMLGYWDSSSYSEFLARKQWSTELLSKIAPERKRVIQAINSALRETQL